MMPHEIEAAFRGAMAEAGLSTPDPIRADGGLHRIYLEGDRRGSRNGWYVLHPDPPVSGAYGCWRRAISGSWSSVEASRLTQADREILLRRAREARAARLVETARRHEEARRRAGTIWSAAAPADPEHPYLVAKQVSAGPIRQRGDRLVLPVMDLDSRLHSLQFIGPDGGKMLLKGGAKKGNVIPVAGRMPGAPRILICEGWATGRTLAEMDPDALVLAAIDAGNLEPVAVAVRRRWPDVEIVLCCDRDPVGIERGRAAAVAASGLVAIPEFPAGVEGSDFNDLHTATRRKAAA